MPFGDTREGVSENEAKSEDLPLFLRRFWDEEALFVYKFIFIDCIRRE